jgi:hypothetical protein
MSADSVVLIADMVLSATAHEADMPVVAMNVAMLVMGQTMDSERSSNPRSCDWSRSGEPVFGAGTLVETRLVGK